MITLKGMTWDHPRGYDGMVATANEYARKHPEVRIVWEKRSLQAFADFPIEQLAAQYDLIVIDHPHMGWVAREGCLIALDQTGRDAELATLASQSLGICHKSYEFDGHQWALTIDAAAQVAAYRPDLLVATGDSTGRAELPTSWDAVIKLAENGKVLWPIKPVDSLMSFTLAANRGTPCAQRANQLIERQDGLVVLDGLAAVARHVPKRCLSMNPIEALEEMSNSDEFIYCPLLYGYSNYSRAGFRKSLVKYANIPALGHAGPCGSCIGGTGIAISAQCKQLDIAVDYAFWIASADCQRGLYFDAGGQPGNLVAWNDEYVNAASNNFFRDTREMLERGWLRPRYAGYLDFQDEGGTIVNNFLAGLLAAEQALDLLEKAYRNGLSQPTAMGPCK